MKAIILISSSKAKRLSLTSSIAVLALLFLLMPDHYLAQTVTSFIGLVINIYTYRMVSRIYKGYVAELTAEQKDTKEGMFWVTVTFALLTVYLLASCLEII